MKFSLPTAVTSRAGIAGLKVQKNAPTLLFGAGIVLGVATVVTACRATLKVETTLDEHRQHVEWAKKFPELNDKERTKEVAVAYGVTSAKLVRLYGPSVILGLGSVACLTQSHRILVSRNAALTAAYTAVDKAYKEYRKRVSDEFGEDKEREIYRAVVEKTEVVKGKDGKKTVKLKESTGGGSGYARLFDETNRNWDTNPDYRTAFLRLQQNWCNDQLNAKGYLFLNDVYDQLGFERTKAGQQVGWISSKYKESKDGVVDFGVFTDNTAQEFYEFNRYGEPIWLDFNVDGPIHDMLDLI